MENLKKWMRRHPIGLTALFAGLYFLWFFLLEKYARPVLFVHSTLDDMIPFCQYFVIPYVLWFLYIAITFLYFLRHSQECYLDLCRYMFTGMIVCLVIYTIIPNGLQLRPNLSGDDICTRIVALIYSSDTPTNVCPSIHVYNSIALNAVIQHYEGFKHNKLVHVSSYILAILICMSTVFLKQHSIIDVFWGCVLGVVLYPLSSRAIMEKRSRKAYKVPVSW